MSIEVRITLRTMIFIYIPCKDKKEAQKLAKILLEANLVACCNLFPVESLWLDNGSIKEGQEFVLIAKTLKKNYRKVKELISKNHSYSIPCIAALNVTRINGSYYHWLKKTLGFKK